MTPTEGVELEFSDMDLRTYRFLVGLDKTGQMKSVIEFTAMKS